MHNQDECATKMCYKEGFMIMRSRQINITVPQKTYERLVEFARSEGVTGSSGEPIIAQAVRRMIRLFLDTHSDPEMENLRGKYVGNTFGMVDLALTEYVKKRKRGNF